jgi:hypothetical protein
MKHTNTNCKMDDEAGDLLLDTHRMPCACQGSSACCRVRRLPGELANSSRPPCSCSIPGKLPNRALTFSRGLAPGCGKSARLRRPVGWPAASRASAPASRMVPGLHVRPLAAMALTVVLLVGGGTYLGVTDWMQPVQPTPLAATVHDLQILDSNAQVLDQMEALSSSNESGD